LTRLLTVQPDYKSVGQI